MGGPIARRERPVRIEAAATITAENVDIETRTITGVAAVYGSVGHTSAGPTIIRAGAISVPDKVVLLVSHDDDRPIGRMVDATDSPDHLVAKFRVIGTGAGDVALLEAGEGIRDGLSVGLEVTSHENDDDGNLVVTGGTLREVSLVTFPAFTEARATNVAASDETPTTEGTDETPTPDTDTVPDNTEQEVTAVDDSTENAAVEAPTVTASIPARVQDPFPYSPTIQASFFRDLVNAAHDVEASRRVNVADQMMTAAQKSADVAQVIPPGYRPDLYVGEEAAGSPLANSMRRMGIDDATPFKIPAFDTAASLVGNHTEGVNPSDGTVAFKEITVTPKAISGKYTASREMLDAANPNLDAIIMAAMAEAYAQNIEGVAAALLITSTTGTNAATGKVTAAVLANLGALNTARRKPADRVAVGSDYFGGLLAETDGSGRPMNPYIAPSNASGTTGGAGASAMIQGLPAVAAWALGAKQAVVFRSADHLLFTSNRLAWRWEEQAGPANIVFAQFGYVAATRTNDAGALIFTNGVTR